MTIKEELKNEWKLSELKAFASELKIPNRSKMNKDQLIQAIELELKSV